VTEEKGSGPMTECEWCRDPDADDVEDPMKLCPVHAAEFEGATLDYIERRAADLGESLDTLE